MVNKNSIQRLALTHNGFYRILKGIKDFPQTIRAKRQYNRDLQQYIKTNSRRNFDYKKEYRWPILMERYEQAGLLDSYFWQDLWCAKRIKEQDEYVDHYDIGSRIDGFIAHLASFRDGIHLIDIRPLSVDIPGVDFVQADATELGGVPSSSIKSISALCSLEHFGLGRYGDPVDPEACFKVFRSIKRVTAKGGHVYISVPIGKEHLEFNAQRVFYASTIINEFAPLKCIEFSVARGSFFERNCDVHKYDNEANNHGARFGLFHFLKE